jgi:acyl-CoA synthetase (AMP-forming)/AMP-acid ligase II
MKRTNLDTLITPFAGSADNRIALVTPGGSVSYVDLLAGRWQRGSKVSVLIHCSELAQIVKAMILLDGHVDALCAIPITLSKDDLSALLTQWPFDYAITDADEETRELFQAHDLTCLTIQDAVSGTPIEPSPADGPRTKWLVPTSGTTSKPKLVVHSLESLARKVLESAKISDPPRVWALFYDVARFAGYQVFFQSLLSGDTLVFPGLTEPIEERALFCANAGVSHISATPTLWRKILMSPASAKLAPVQITLGGEASDQPILTSLAAKYPNARVTHIYASTEAGVGLAVSDGRAGYPMSYTEKPFGGVEIRLSDDKLQIKAAANPERYANGNRFADADGWVETGDMVKVEGDRFFIIGRKSGIINVGGDKVIPEQVRDALLDCELVHEAVVYGKQNPFTGALVAADIVLSEPMSKTDARAAIDAFLHHRLSPPERPRVMRFVSEILTTATGKVMPKQ